jgi:HK97 family phage major capsid protein
MARSHPWQSYGIDSMIAAAAKPGPVEDRRHAPAEAISNLIAGTCDQPLLSSGGKGCVSYWLPASREEVRTLLSGSASNGGNLIAGAMLARVAAAARPVTVLERAGASRVVVPLGAGEYVVPRFSESTAGSWLEEGAEADAPGLTVNTGSAIPKLCAARTLISRRLRLQTIDPIEPLLLLELQRSNQSLMELAFFNGPGGKVPLGICQTPGVATESFVGALPTWSEVTAMIDDYIDSQADYSRAAWFTGPAMATGLMAAQKASGNGGFIVDPGPQIAGLPLYVSTAVPAGKLLLLDPSRVVLAFWNSPSLMIDPYTNDTSGSTLLILHNACDLVATDPAQIVIGTAGA